MVSIKEQFKLSSKQITIIGGVFCVGKRDFFQGSKVQICEWDRHPFNKQEKSVLQQRRVVKHRCVVAVC